MFMNATFGAWSDTVWAANRTGPKSIATGNAAAWLPFPVISSRAADLASALTAQNHTLHLPADTDPTVAAGYRAQMLAFASALTSPRTAFYNLVVTGGNTNGLLCDLHPLSRGTVNIDVADPYNTVPRVDYRALANPLDAAIMADIIRFTRRYHMENPLTEAWAATELAPGEETQTDEEFEAYLAETLSPSVFHPVGTCAMMPRELGGVVDEELRVYGVKGLRVVDASIMSTLVGGNTCQTVYAVAEKVSRRHDACGVCWAWLLTLAGCGSDSVWGTQGCGIAYIRMHTAAKLTVRRISDVTVMPQNRPESGRTMTMRNKLCKKVHETSKCFVHGLMSLYPWHITTSSTNYAIVLREHACHGEEILPTLSSI
jgi:hypothetical protein